MKKLVTPKALPLETLDAAKLLEVTSERVRQLEREGVIHADRTASGKRLFDINEVMRVKAEREKK